MLSQAIVSTLAYHALFDYPLTANQLHQLLICRQPVTRSNLENSLEKLVARQRVVLADGWFLAARPKPAIRRRLALRKRRVLSSRKKLAIAARAAGFFSFIPWVRLVAVTGALTMQNADEADDIDLMVVTAKNRLWLVRPLIALLASLFFQRRKPISSSFSNALCLNLWLDEAALVIPSDQRNLYTAHELAQMKPLVNNDSIYQRMMGENEWGKRYLANFWQRVKGWQVGRLKRSNPLTIQPLSRFDPFNLLNLLTFRLQLWYMKPKMTAERVSLHAAFFHPGERSREILTRYRRLLGL